MMQLFYNKIRDDDVALNETGFAQFKDPSVNKGRRIQKLIRNATGCTFTCSTVRFPVKRMFGKRKEASDILLKVC